MFSVEQMLSQAVSLEASDVHINVGMPPVIRKNTELFKMELSDVSKELIEKLVCSMLDEEDICKLKKNRDLDFAMMIDSGIRFRVNAHYQKGNLAVSFRIIKNTILPIEELELPEVVSQIIDLPRGLVLVTGPTGSGKSTTLASMINRINELSSKRIITLEDPIEYLYENNKCQIEQREVGSDVTGFASGLKHSMRQDPDIIMVGEMRDLETTSAAISAAETGHLVLSTLHTINATQTIERIVDIYPDGRQDQIRSLLANTLKAVISQTLFKRRDCPGMVPCVEILIASPAAKNCIRENRLHEIPNLIQTARQIGMQTLDGSIAEMFFRGFISKKDAIAKSSNQAQMQKMLGNVYEEDTAATKIY
jgi:twitching motility protein PilT